jgi:crotonobetainyl-CoA:carnitine CoA-transferase CaiB-like acyl-CoA transferase
MLLADLGAEVLRIDRTEPSDLGIPTTTRFDVSGRNRRSIALDIKQPAGRDAALRLIDRADVMIEGWRPGVAERLGMGPEVCLARNPGLVFGRMTGFGLGIGNRLLTRGFFGNGHTLRGSTSCVMCDTGSAAALNMSFSGIDFFSR